MHSPSAPTTQNTIRFPNMYLQHTRRHRLLLYAAAAPAYIHFHHDDVRQLWSKILLILPLSFLLLSLHFSCFSNRRLHVMSQTEFKLKNKGTNKRQTGILCKCLLLLLLFFILILYFILFTCCLFDVRVCIIYRICVFLRMQTCTNACSFARHLVCYEIHIGNECRV